MKFVVERTKSTVFEDEYRISLPDKTKDKLKKLAGGLIVAGGAAAVIVHLTSDKTENDPESTESL